MKNYLKMENEFKIMRFHLIIIDISSDLKIINEFSFPNLKMQIQQRKYFQNGT